MNNFTINGQLNSDKKLTLTQNCCLSAGENMSTLLHIDIPAEYSQYSYQIEFECPDNYTYTTPKLTVNNQQSQYYIEYTLESCILQNAGQVKVQVLVRQSTDDSILFKSTLSSGSTLQISASVNDRGQSYAKQDFFATAYTTMDKLLDIGNQLDSNKQNIEEIKQRCDDFLNDYQQKLDSGELRGPMGATIVSIVETGKDLDGNGIYTVTLSDGQQFNFTVPAGKQGEKGDKGDKGDTGEQGEYITNVTLSQTMSNGDNQYKITTNLGNSFYFVSPKGTAGETLVSLTYTSTDAQGNRTYTFNTNTGKTFSFVSVKGDKGDKGDTGATGAQGAQGPKGDKGDTPSLNGTYPDMTVGKALSDGNGNNIADTYAPKNTAYRPNIIINSNFAINQRGKLTYAQNQQYTVDHWGARLESGGTIEIVENNNIKFTMGSLNKFGGICQTIENPTQYLGKTLTISAKLKNTKYTSNIFRLIVSNSNGAFFVGNILGGYTGTLQDGVYSTTFTMPQTLQDGYDYVNVFVDMSNCNFGDTFTIEWVKLEEGEYATPYYAPDKMTELLRCQRYFGRITAGNPYSRYGGIAYAEATNQFMLSIPYANIRTVPTITSNGNFRIVTPSAVYTVENLAIKDANSNELIVIALIDGNATVGTVGFLSANNDTTTYIDIDAEM